MGYKLAGYTVLGNCEIDPEMMKLYRRNHHPKYPYLMDIREFGFLNPLIIDGDCGIIAGHGRVLAAQEEGMEKVPCVLADHLSEAQKKAYILADNRMAMDAGWDEELLRIEIESLQGEEFDVSLTGFREDEVTDLFAVREDPDDTGSNKEYDEGEFGDEEFAHECPRCGFKFN